MRRVIKLPNKTILPDEQQREQYDPELKYYTTIQESSAILTATLPWLLNGVSGTVSPTASGQLTVINTTLNNVQLGDQPYNRTSRTILVNRIQAKLYVGQDQTRNGGANTTILQPWNIINIRFYVDTKFNGGKDYTPQGTQEQFCTTVAAMLNTTTTNYHPTISEGPQSMMTWPNESNEERFICIWDHTTTFNQQANINTVSGNYGFGNSWATSISYFTMPYQPPPQCSWIDVDIPNIQIPIMFDDKQSQGSLASIRTNNIFVVANHIATTTSPAIHASFRISFISIP